MRARKTERQRHWRGLVLENPRFSCLQPHVNHADSFFKVFYMSGYQVLNCYWNNLIPNHTGARCRGTLAWSNGWLCCENPHVCHSCYCYVKLARKLFCMKLSHMIAVRPDSDTILEIHHKFQNSKLFNIYCIFFAHFILIINKDQIIDYRCLFFLYNAITYKNILYWAHF